MIPFYNKYVDIKTFRVHGDSLLFKQIHSFNQDEWMTDLKEPVITINKGEINLIFRNYSHPGVYISQRSLESHGTFSVPKQTNMISENRISLPLLFFDAQFTRKYWFLAGDRPYNNKEKSKLYLYSNEDMGNPFTFEQSIDRPIPNSWQFYGYPTVTLMKNGKYLVVFTESYMDYENNENADFYQFTLTPTKSKIVSK